MTKWLALSLGEGVLALYDYDFEGIVFSDPDPELGEMTQKNARYLLKLLRAWRGTGRTIVCWDGMRTVWPWLAEKTGQRAQVAYEAKQSVDCSLTLYWSIGYTPAFDQICDGLSIEIDTNWADLILNREAYPDKAIPKYLVYELTNARATYQIAVETEDQGAVSWESRAGKYKAIDIGARWPTVAKVLEKERVEATWAEYPTMPREFLEWMP